MCDGEVSGCGIRAFAAASGTPDDLRGFDLSVNVMRSGMATVKVISFDTSLSDLKQKKPFRRAFVEAAWVKAPSQTATRPDQRGFMRADDGLSVLYLTDPNSIFSIFHAQAEGLAVTIGIQRRGESSVRIYVGCNQPHASRTGAIRTMP